MLEEEAGETVTYRQASRDSFRRRRRRTQGRRGTHQRGSSVSPEGRAQPQPESQNMRTNDRKVRKGGLGGLSILVFIYVCEINPEQVTRIKVYLYVHFFMLNKYTEKIYVLYLFLSKLRTLNKKSLDCINN